MTFFNLRWPGSVFDVSPDVSHVVAASQALDIKEFRLFRVAFAWWFGRNAADSDIERPFMRYLATEQAPPWVRHFTREVMTRVDEGRLDPQDFGLPPLPPPDRLEPQVQLGLRILYGLTWLGAIVVLALGIG